MSRTPGPGLARPLLLGALLVASAYWLGLTTDGRGVTWRAATAGAVVAIASITGASLITAMAGHVARLIGPSIAGLAVVALVVNSLAGPMILSRAADLAGTPTFAVAIMTALLLLLINTSTPRCWINVFTQTRRAVSRGQTWRPRVVCVLGGCIVDLRQAAAPDPGRAIQLSCWGGLIDVQVPGSWRLLLESTSNQVKVSEWGVVPQELESSTLSVTVIGAAGHVRFVRA